MSNKSPYEIRAEIIQLASSHLQQQYQSNLEFSRKLFEKTLETIPTPKSLSVESALEFQKKLMDQFKDSFPQVPSIEEITKKATELYSFVTKKD